VRICFILIFAMALTSARSFGVTLEPKSRDSRRYLAASPAELARLVEELGSDDWRARDEATRTLIEVGPKAKAELEKALGSADAEVRWRASHILAQVGDDLRPPEHEPARILYASAAEARAQKNGADAARALYGAVIERFPGTRWARSARERLVDLLGGETEDPAEDGGDAEALVAALASKDWATRQDASRRLADMGEAVRPLLSKAAEGADLEVAWRARRLVERLDAVRKPPPDVAPRLDLGLLRAERAAPRRGVQPPAVAAHMDGFVASLGSKDASEVSVARNLLLELDQEAVGALVRGLADCDEVAGVEIMDMLVKLTGQDLGFRRARWRAWWDAASRRKE